MDKKLPVFNLAQQSGTMATTQWLLDNAITSASLTISGCSLKLLTSSGATAYTVVLAPKV
jgi:hypothetical protein